MSLKTNNPIAGFSLILGAIVGTALSLQGRMERFSESIQRRFS